MIEVGDIVSNSRGVKFRVTKIDSSGDFTYFYLCGINKDIKTSCGRKVFESKFKKDSE